MTSSAPEDPLHADAPADGTGGLPPDQRAEPPGGADQPIDPVGPTELSSTDEG
jgi:hypothetical protein